VTFVTVGAVNTVLYFLLFNLLRLGLPAFGANTVAVAISIGFSFWANRRFTFRWSGSHRGWRQFVEFGLVFVVTLLISNGALALLFSIRDSASVLEENLALIVSSGILVLVRFWIMRGWVFDPDRT
jgi:putative flippase GtrA